MRGLCRQPAFACLAVLTLALGIGAATIRDLSNARPGGRNFFQVPEFLEYQEQSHVFEEVIGGTPEDVLQSTDEGTELLTGGAVTANNFSFLGSRRSSAATCHPTM